MGFHVPDPMMSVLLLLHALLRVKWFAQTDHAEILRLCVSEESFAIRIVHFCAQVHLRYALKIFRYALFHHLKYVKNLNHSVKMENAPRNVPHPLLPLSNL
jgi:hypothetical protein